MSITKTTRNWPALNYADYGETVATVQLWAQIIGKVRLSKSPWVNHSWHVTLYVNSRGFTTGAIPHLHGNFELAFNFISHRLIITTSNGGEGSIQLKGQSVASFYKELMHALTELNIDTRIYASPNEIDPAIPFAEDEIHQTYDGPAMNTLWQAFLRINNVFNVFRARFTGKCSPVHLFWGAFDLAVTRFSERVAPLHPGGMPNMPLRVMQEAYSHEVSSCGFWPGGKDSPQPVFYAYCYPTPNVFGKQQVEPSEAFYSAEMGEFFLPYNVVQQSAAPEEIILKFLQSTYEAAANTAKWDRKSLECDLTGFEVKAKG